jgi:small subunit ribosomal protein S13
MARIAGLEINDNWKVDFALTRIAGIGWALSKKILAETKIDTSHRVSNLTPEDIAKITAQLEGYTIEGDLARQTRADIKRLQAINSYRGNRHSHGLPLRGQRTRSNARTKRGKRKTVGAFKKEMLAKMTTPEKK